MTQCIEIPDCFVDVLGAGLVPPAPDVLESIAGAVASKAVGSKGSSDGINAFDAAFGVVLRMVDGIGHRPLR